MSILKTGQNDLVSTVDTGQQEVPQRVSKLDTHDLGEAFISLAQELWVTKDRLAMLEAYFVNQGTLAPGAINTFQPDDSVVQELSEERKRFLQSTLRSLKPE